MKKYAHFVLFNHSKCEVVRWSSLVIEDSIMAGGCVVHDQRFICVPWKYMPFTDG